ncbi:hypothetical protein Hdeb2414_s0016g00485951 [Helianthus debilis subsp. tardiflorus]
MHPYRPPFGGPARPTNPNTTQPQTPYNLQDMDPSFLSYAAYLSGAPPFVPTTYGFGQAGGSQPSQPEPESEPDVEVVPESQPETVESSSDLDLKDDFEEMNRRLQDIRDLGHKRWEIMKDRVVETKKFNELQEARQMEKDIEFLSKPIDHLQGDALILAQMRRQKIREKYGL